jgi:hypothetical protein
MTAKYRQFFPPMLITNEILKAWREQDLYLFRVLIDWKPWEFDPMSSVLLWKPGPREIPSQYTKSPYNRSWWKAMAIRERMEELTDRPAQLRKARKAQEDLAQQAGD